MRNLRKQLFLGLAMAVLCLGAFAVSATAQRRGVHFSFGVSVGSPYRAYYPRYRYQPRRVHRRYYAPPPVYYNSGYYSPAYYAPQYYVTNHRRYHRHRRGDNCRRYRY